MEEAAMREGALLEELRTRCREAGMNITPQRSAVYKAMVGAPDHPTPEDLYVAVRAEMPDISLATIYKSLEALKKLGIVREVARLGEARRFDANLDHHHHTICIRCGRVRDLDHAEFEGLQPPQTLEGFVPSEVTVQVFGECSTCAGASVADDEI